MHLPIVMALGGRSLVESDALLGMLSASFDVSDTALAHSHRGNDFGKQNAAHPYASMDFVRLPCHHVLVILYIGIPNPVGAKFTCH